MNPVTPTQTSSDGFDILLETVDTLEDFLDQFGLLVDDLDPNEQVTLFFETESESEPATSE